MRAVPSDGSGKASRTGQGATQGTRRIVSIIVQVEITETIMQVDPAPIM